MFKNSKAPRGAFTLIEILVVLGIIGILSALLFPVLARARENGRKAVCNSNMRQLGVAFSQYTQDYGGRYPFAGQYQIWANGASWVTGGKIGSPPQNFGDAVTDVGPIDTERKGGLAASTAPKNPGDPAFEYFEGREAKPAQGALFSYAKSEGIYACPSSKDSNKKKLSYSMNCAIAGIAQNRIRRPDQTILLIDEGDTLNDGFFWATDKFGNSPTDSLFQGHNGGGNLLFSDGHVKFYTFKELPLDWNGSATEVGSGINLKGITEGDTRFHDKSFGPKGSNYIPALNPGASATPPVLKDSCNADVSPGK